MYTYDIFNNPSGDLTMKTNNAFLVKLKAEKQRLTLEVKTLDFGSSDWLMNFHKLGTVSAMLEWVRQNPNCFQPS